jgi:hypothetical protein
MVVFPMVKVGSASAGVARRVAARTRASSSSMLNGLVT